MSLRAPCFKKQIWMPPEETHTTLVFLNLASLMSRPSPWLLKAFVCERLDSEQDLLGWGGRGVDCLHSALVLSLDTGTFFFTISNKIFRYRWVREGSGESTLITLFWLEMQVFITLPQPPPTRSSTRHITDLLYISLNESVVKRGRTEQIINDGF